MSRSRPEANLEPLRKTRKPRTQLSEVIHAKGHDEFIAVMGRAKKGEFKILGMKFGRTNASYIFSVSHNPDYKQLSIQF